MFQSGPKLQCVCIYQGWGCVNPWGRRRFYPSMQWDISNRQLGIDSPGIAENDFTLMRKERNAGDRLGAYRWQTGYARGAGVGSAITLADCAIELVAFHSLECRI